MNNLLPCLVCLATVACGRGATASSNSQREAAPPSTPASQIDDTDSKQFRSFFVKDDTLSYKGFNVVRRYRIVREKGFPKVEIPVNYAVLKKDSRVLRTFDGVYFGAGNAIDFGLASMLGGDAKQLLVSQTIPRGGRHWIVDLSSDAAVLFDSGDYDIGGEDVAVFDRDKDGVLEIGLSVDKFWLIGGMPMAGRPQPFVTFKYDASSRKYLPNVPGPTDELGDIVNDAQALESGKKPNNYVANRLDILLRYVYAGRRDEGWAFFERTYTRPDKEEIKAQLKKRLDRDRVYQYIYPR